MSFIGGEALPPRMPKSDGPFFSRETIQFLVDLAAHNDKTWFTANKGRYETEVRDRAMRFVAEMGPRMAKFSSHLVADPRPVGGSLSRIYRDLRFSPDKRPYRTNVGIHFYHEKVDQGAESLPGFYLHIMPGESFVASGVWHPAPPALLKIRQRIVAKPSEWARAHKGVELGGESLKRVPPGFDAESPVAEDLKRKDFIASVDLPDASIVSAEFPTRFLAACARLQPLNDFVATAAGIPW